MNKSKDLWPELLLEEVATPVSILASQAKLIAGKTGNLLRAEVKTLSRVSGKNAPDQFEHNFNLVAPSLDNFRHRILHVIHGIQPYPVTLITRKSEAVIENEKDFCTRLGEIFADPETVNAIRMLYAQSKVKED